VKELIIHVGHGKTGSSHLQSLLALNVTRLNQKGIAYPFDNSFDGASRGYISSGNGKRLSLTNIESHAHSKVLFSGESLFYHLLNSELLSSLAKFYKLKIILYTRDVVEHALSRWSQAVKRAGLKRDVDSYLFSNPVGPYPLVLEWINQSRSLGFDLIIKNYTKNKIKLASSFLKGAFGDNVDFSDLVLPGAEKINRSLTYSEYEIQRVFNAAFGRESAEYISDFLVNNFPNFTAYSVKISKKTYIRLIEANARYVEQINACLEPEEHISFGSEYDFVVEYGNAFLSTEVVEVLGENIRKHFSRFAYQNKDVQLLRDTALKIEGGGRVGLSDALALMQIALRNRPDGPLIKGKVKDWTEQLKSTNSD